MSKNKNPKFSIIIPTRNINNYIRKAMPYYLKQTYKNFEIIVVTESEESEKFPNTKIIKVGKVPPSEKRNIGVKHSKGEIVAFIDDDAYPENSWLENSLEDFENKSVSCIGGPSLNPRDSSFFQKVAGKVYELSSGKTGIRYKKGKNKILVEDWPTCNFFVRREDFLQAGGFDSEYWGGEDTRLCYELSKIGKKILYSPKVCVFHYQRENLKSYLQQTIFWGIWRGFLIKSYSKKSFKPTFIIPPLFVMWVLVGAFLAIFSETFRYFYFGSFFIYLTFLFATGMRTKSSSLFFPVILVTFLAQFSYGLGFFRGILSKNPTNKTFNPAENDKITN